ncbi:MAG: hypothetical protein MPW14_17645 [Candidatus Manganitrophus sp.]|nr:MAG: hypothetical protein MPW14_17645 [Candidatus Manganitrophus sp.]
MGHLDPFSGAGENDGMVSDHISAAQRLNADLAAGTRADVPLPGEAADLREGFFRARANTSPIRRAVPLGASLFCR